MELPIQSAEVKDLVNLIRAHPAKVLEMGSRLLRRGEKTPDGNYLMTLNIMAAAALALREFGKAQKYVNTGLKVDRNPHLLHTLAQIYSKQGDPVKALEIVDEAIFLQGAEPEYYRTKASLLYQLDQLDELNELISTAYFPKAFPGPTEMYLGGIARKTGDPEGAKRHLEKAISLDGTNPSFFFELAAIHREAGEDAMIIETLRRIDVASYPNEHYFIELGTAYARLNDDKPAREYLQRAIEINPTNLAANISLAMLDRQDGRPEASILRLKKLLEQGLPPELQPPLLREMGYCYRENKHLAEDAFLAFNRAHAIERMTIEGIEEQLQQVEALANNALAIAKTDFAGDGGEKIVLLVALPSAGYEAIMSHLTSLGHISELDEPSIEGSSALTRLETGVYWHNHILIMLPELLSNLPKATVVFLRQHPKDVCLENTRRAIASPGTLDSPFFKWDTTISYIELLLEIWSTLEATNPAKLTLSIEAITNRDQASIDALGHIIGIDPGAVLPDKASVDCRPGEWVHYSEVQMEPSNTLDRHCVRLGYMNY